MKFKSQLITAASGSVGGVTASHNKGGMYLRARATPTNPSSPAQVARRGQMTSASGAWSSSLTDVQRDAWRTYAANVPATNPFGDKIQLSGQQMFVRSSIAGQMAGFAADAFADAPTTFNFGDPGTITPTAASDASNEFVMAFSGSSDWANDDDGKLICRLGLPQNPSIGFFKGPFRFCNVIDGNSLTPPIVGEIDGDDATPPIALTQGQRVWAAVGALAPDGRYTGQIVLGPLTVGI